MPDRLPPPFAFDRSVPVSVVGKRALRVAAVLLLVDCVLIAGDLLHSSAIVSDRRLLLTTERGYPELFQYLKLGGVAAVLLILAVRWNSAPTLAWSVLFAFLLFDDAFQVHERAGRALAARLPLPAWGQLRPNQFGELLYFGALAVAVAGLITIAARRGSSRDHALSAVVVIGIALLSVFGVGLDALHALASDPARRHAMAVVEEGGEMVIASALCAVTMAWPGVWPILRRDTDRTSGGLR